MITTKATAHPEASISAVIEAYEKLHDACENQAYIAASNGDTHSVYLWIKHSIAASAKIRKLKQYGIL